MLTASQRTRQRVETALALHVALKAAGQRRNECREDAHRLRVAKPELLAHLFHGAAVLRRKDRIEDVHRRLHEVAAAR